MQQDWIIDVLGDLKSFAQKNGLLALARQLDETILVAAADLAPGCGAQCAAKACGDEAGALPGAHEAGDVV